MPEILPPVNSISAEICLDGRSRIPWSYSHMAFLPETSPHPRFESHLWRMFARRYPVWCGAVVV